MDASHIEAIKAIVFGLFADHVFLQADLGHDGLEGGSRGVLGHQRPVEEGFQGVGDKHPVLGPQVSSHQKLG